MSTETETTTRLYGLPFAERLHFELEDAIDEARDLDPIRPVEEWAVHEPQYHLPTAEQVAEWCGESAGENECTEDGAEAFWEPTRDPDVIAAFRSALDVMASKVTFRHASKRLATWHPPSGDPADETPWIRKAEA